MVVAVADGDYCSIAFADTTGPAGNASSHHYVDRRSGFRSRSFSAKVGAHSAKETTVGLTIHSMAIDTLVPLLRTLSTLLDKGADHVKAKGAKPDSLAEARLAPDMYPLAKQVQIACDQAKSAAARLTGQEPPKFEDTEQTLDQLKARIRRTLDYVEGVPATAYQGAETRRVELPLMNDLVLDMSGEQFLRDWVLPNFYFHIVTAYDILRSQGVQIGKQDYMAHVAYAIHPKGK